MIRPPTAPHQPAILRPETQAEPETRLIDWIHDCFTMADEPLPMSRAEPEGDDDQLVAYLDGELSPQESDAVERQLADNPALRRRLQELQQAWDALDRLPQSSTAGTFTRSTIELVTREAAREIRRNRRTRPDVWAQRFAAALLAIACAWGGFQLMRWYQTAESRQLARDLRVIENMDFYRSIDSLEFLQQLEQSGLFIHEDNAND